MLQEQGLGGLVLADDLMLPNQAFITPETTLAETMRRFSARHVDVLPVVESAAGKRFMGVLSRSAIIDAYNREILRQSALGFRFLKATQNEARAESVELPEEYVTRDMPVPPSMVGRTLRDIDLRTRQGITVLAVRHPGMRQADEIPDPDSPLPAGSRIVVVGKVSDMSKLEEP